MEKLRENVKENALRLQQNLNHEKRCNGLVILEAYYGLDEHIYRVDAGLLLYQEPKSVKDYYE